VPRTNRERFGSARGVVGAGSGPGAAFAPGEA